MIMRKYIKIMQNGKLFSFSTRNRVGFGIVTIEELNLYESDDQ